MKLIDSKLIEFVESLNNKLGGLYTDEGHCFIYTSSGYSESIDFNFVKLWDPENYPNENIEKQVIENFQKYISDLCTVKERINLEG